MVRCTVLRRTVEQLNVESEPVGFNLTGKSSLPSVSKGRKLSNITEEIFYESVKGVQFVNCYAKLIIELG